MKCLKANCRSNAIADSVYCFTHQIEKKEQKHTEESIKLYQEKMNAIQDTTKEIRKLCKKLGDLIGGL
jgi:hypothetical protein